jgi:hypothetical protein
MSYAVRLWYALEPRFIGSKRAVHGAKQASNVPPHPLPELVRCLSAPDHDRTTAMRLFTGFERSFSDLVCACSDLVRHHPPDMRCPLEWTHDKADWRRGGKFCRVARAVTPPAELGAVARPLTA